MKDIEVYKMLLSSSSKIIFWLIGILQIIIIATINRRNKLIDKKVNSEIFEAFKEGTNKRILKLEEWKVDKGYLKLKEELFNQRFDSINDKFKEMQTRNTADHDTILSFVKDVQREQKSTNEQLKQISSELSKLEGFREAKT